MTALVRLARFLLRMSRELGAARSTFVAIVTAGILAGLGNTALIALLNERLHTVGERRWLLATFVALLCLVPMLRFLSQFLLIRLGSGTILDLRVQLGRRILGAPLRQLETIGPSRLLAHLTDDIGTIGEALVQIPLIAMHLAVVAGALVYLLWLSPRLFVVLLIGLAVGTVSYQLPVLRSLDLFRRARAQWDQMIGHFQGLTSGIKELKLHRERRSAFESQLYRPTAQRIRTLSLRGSVILAAANSWGHALFFVLAGVLVFGGGDALGVDRAVLTGYTLTLLFLMSPLEVILNTLPNLSRASIAAERVESLRRELEVAPGLASSPEGAAFRDFHRLELVSVCHSFVKEDGDQEFLLGPIDLAIERGELLFVIGGNGSGKTTLAKLLVGLYAPRTGEIRVDGRTVRDAERDAYRQLFSAVFTDFYLFDRLLGLDATDLDRHAAEWLERLQLTPKVRIEDGRLSTLDLSQGQRKRLALLTAYLEDRPIYLFDEWAADQDPLFKDVFYQQLLPALRERGRTAVVISHDDRYYWVADRIVKIEDGRLSGVSTPPRLREVR